MNTWDRIGREECERQCEENPQLFAALAEKKRQVKQGLFPIGLVECVFQYNHWAIREHLYDYHVWIDLYMAIRVYGTISVFNIPLGKTPHADRNQDWNNEELASLPQPFTGYFEGGPNSGNDGYIKWSRPIHSVVCTQESGGLWVLIDTGVAALEVGSYSAGRFKEWMVCGGGSLARWPYDHDYITVFCHQFAGDKHKDFSRMLLESGERIEDVASARDPWILWNRQVDEVWGKA